MYRDIQLQREADQRRQRALLAAGKAAPPPIKSVPERVASFAEARKLSAEATVVLRVVIEHHERTGEPYTADGFELADAAGITHEAATKAKGELHIKSVLRTRSGNVFGVDGLVPGDAWVGPGKLSATWSTGRVRS